MLLKLAFRNVVTKKSSYVIILFIAFAISLFCVSNAIFDSTEKGIQSNYISSFTGDFFVRPDMHGGQYSLFGDETPVTGELTKLEKLLPYADIKNTLLEMPEVSSVIGQVTGVVAMEYNGSRTPVYLFGVHADEYFENMTSVKVVEGNMYSKGEKSVMLSRFMANQIGASVGSEVQFEVTDGPTFRLRKATVTGIYDYDIQNAIFERFIIIDPDTLRDILDIQENEVVEDIYIEDEKTNLLSDDFDFDSLFDDAFDAEAEYEGFDEFEIFSESEDYEEENFVEEDDYYESLVWNFLICKVNPEYDTNAVIRKANRIFKKNGWGVNAAIWRFAAGSTALYLYWLRMIFNIGITIVLIAGFIIVNNTLTVNVLERAVEIGTMRAVGAKKKFISLQCMVETFMMTVSGGVIGTLIGILVSQIITHLHIAFSNSFLIQLFGSSNLVVNVTGANIGKLFILVIVLGVLGWIYPVVNALKVTPVKAMQGGK